MRTVLSIVGLVPLAIFACAESASTDAEPTAPIGDGGSAAPDGKAMAPTGPSAPKRDAAAGEQLVELHFEARVGDERFACGKTFSGFGTTNADVVGADFRFFVHDVELVRADGRHVNMTLDRVAPWQGDRVALLDFEDKTGACQNGTTGTNDVIYGAVPTGEYRGIIFAVGVPEDLNHVNVALAEAPLAASKLQWNWTQGFIHLSTQFNPTTPGSQPFYVHLGSTECAGSPATGAVATCKRENKPIVRLSDFDPTKDKIVIDARRIYAGANVETNAPSTSAGCMSSPTDADCGPIFDNLGVDFASGIARQSQRAFAVEAR